ncbi:MAG TPA: glycosyltransferase 87 family protein [Streptosporangiaceae bacterium]|nr:glycosyltransferase 87 family protein [Streptosporangiaceae bacterium]
MTLPDRSLRDLSLSRPGAREAAWWALGLAILLVAGFAIAYNSFDFNVYRWGGLAVTHGMRLYLVQVDARWFTYTPFAAVVFVPMAHIPVVVARLAWALISLLALAVAANISLKMAGYRPTRPVLAGVTAVSVTLEPVYHTLFLGQINLIFLALILIDVMRTANGKVAGVGIGIAAGIKLVPLIFIALFIVTRRTKSAMIAAGTFLTCGLIGYLVAPGDSGLYWHHLFYNTTRVGAAYISNQSAYAAAARIAGGVGHVGHWFLVFPAVIGLAGLAIAAVLARHQDWLGAATVTGATGLIVSPISWSHHWVWILPTLIILANGGRRARIAAACSYVLFVAAPMWFTPRTGGPSMYGFHGLLTVIANSYLLAGLAFLGYMGWYAAKLGRGTDPPSGMTPARIAEPAGTRAYKS